MLSQQQSEQGKFPERHIGSKTSVSAVNARVWWCERRCKGVRSANVFLAKAIHADSIILGGQLWKQDYLKMADFKFLGKVGKNSDYKKDIIRCLCFSLRWPRVTPLLISNKTIVTMRNTKKSIGHKRIEFTHNPIMVFSHLCDQSVDSSHSICSICHTY